MSSNTTNLFLLTDIRDRTPAATGRWWTILFAGSAVMLLLLSAPALPETVRLSKNPDGSQILDRPIPPGVPTILGNGRMFIYERDDPDRTGTRGIQFVHDRTADTTTATIDWLPVGTDGEPPNARTLIRRISEDSNTVVIRSDATNLTETPATSTPGTTTPISFFYVDRSSAKYYRFNYHTLGNVTFLESTGWPSLSSDGRYLASSGRGYTSSPTGAREPFNGVVVLDTTTERYTVIPDDAITISGERRFVASISTDGRYLLLEVLRRGPPGVPDYIELLRFDRNTGTSVIVNVSETGAPLREERSTHDVMRPTMSQDGQRVAYYDERGYCYVHDIGTSVATRFPVSRSISSSVHCDRPQISGNGRFVGFYSDDPAIAPDDTNGALDTFVYNTRSGQVSLVSADPTGAAGNDGSRFHPPVITTNGRHLAYLSNASNLVSDDTNGMVDLFLSSWHEDPREDAYESNDTIDDAAPLPDAPELWSHLHAACVDNRTGTWGADSSCPGIFDDYDRISASPPRVSVDVWSRRLEGLSLHSVTDRDFFRITPPDPADYDPSKDINSGRAGSGTVTLPAKPMPECEVLQRWSAGRRGTTEQVFVNVVGRLDVTVIPSSDGVAGFDLDTDGESLRIYGDSDPTQLAEGSDSPLKASVYCPTSDSPERGLNLDSLVISLGERIDARRRDQTGNYDLLFEYVIEAQRGIPRWVYEMAFEREIRAIGRLPCRQSDSLFNTCDRETTPDMRILHPFSPRLVPCWADGPGCFDIVALEFARTVPNLELVLTAPDDYQFTLYSQNEKVVATSSKTNRFIKQDQVSETTYNLSAEDLLPGAYFLTVEGPPGDYKIDFSKMDIKGSPQLKK